MTHDPPPAVDLQQIAEHLAHLLLDDPVIAAALAGGGPDTLRRLVDHALALCLGHTPVEPAPRIRLGRDGVTRLVMRAETALACGGIPVGAFMHGLGALETAAATWAPPRRRWWPWPW